MKYICIGTVDTYYLDRMTSSGSRIELTFLTVSNPTSLYRIDLFTDQQDWALLSTAMAFILLRFALVMSS
jgi:hypothetical protein